MPGCAIAPPVTAFPPALDINSDILPDLFLVVSSINWVIWPPWLGIPIMPLVCVPVGSPENWVI